MTCCDIYMDSGIYWKSLHTFPVFPPVAPGFLPSRDTCTSMYIVAPGAALPPVRQGLRELVAAGEIIVGAAYYAAPTKTTPLY